MHQKDKRLLEENITEEEYSDEEKDQEIMNGNHNNYQYD
jgi:hypothetical protein